jgi:hypothetical protein
MKTFLGAKNKQIDRQTAMALTGINLLATPGLGTILAGRFIVGIVQLLFAVAGFCLIILWFYSKFKGMLASAPAGPDLEWQMGLLLFGIGWILSLISSLSLIKNSGATARKPPRLDGTPG